MYGERIATIRTYVCGRRYVLPVDVVLADSCILGAPFGLHFQLSGAALGPEIK